MTYSRGQVAEKVRSYKELHPSEYCPVRGCLWRITDREGNTISECRKHPLRTVTPASNSTEGK